MLFVYCLLFIFLFGVFVECEKKDQILVVLSTGKGLWNTGVWSGYGEGPVAELKWAASGIKVDKTKCQTKIPCFVTKDESKTSIADAVIMETVNHPKFLQQNADHIPFPFPQQTFDPETGLKKPLFGMFYYEPSAWYPQYTSAPEFRQKFDFVMGPEQHSDVPLTMICPWGKTQEDYLSPRTASPNSRLIAYFSPYNLDPYYDSWIHGLIHEAGDSIESFGPLGTMDLPSIVSQSTPNKIEFMKNYKFILVTESIVMDDWVSAEFSQALLAGAVPIYIGAPNIENYLPGNNSIIHIRDWITQHPKNLINYLKYLDSSPNEYQKYFEWKNNGLLNNFKEKFNQCVYYAECRVCNLVTQKILNHKNDQTILKQNF